MFYVDRGLLPISRALLIAVYGAAAINIFYWYGGVIVANSVHTITGATVPWIRWPVRIIVALLSIIWISRTYWSERGFFEESGAGQELIQITPKATKALEQKADRMRPRSASWPRTRRSRLRSA